MPSQIVSSNDEMSFCDILILDFLPVGRQGFDICYLCFGIFLLCLKLIMPELAADMGFGTGGLHEADPV